MAEPLSSKQQLKAFINAAQHIAGLNSGQDIWEEGGQLLLRFFNADFVAFGSSDTAANITIEHRQFSGAAASLAPAEHDLAKVVREVCDSGFMAFASLPPDRPLLTLAAIPVSHRNQLAAVMLVGHLTGTRPDQELLDFYLAVAGLLGAAYSRSKSAAAVLEATEDAGRLNAELEKQLEERTAQLTVAKRELEAFAYSVSHDLRAPLRYMAGFANLLLNRSEALPDDKSRYFANAIVRAAKSMDLLIDGVLAFSRVGRVEMQKVEVNLRELMLNSIKELAGVTRNRDISWNVGPLPNVWGDPELLKLVCDNLLSNAVKFTGPRPMAEISVGYRQEADDYVFFVRDNGVGFDTSQVDRLFGVFHRLHTQDEFEGTGIGLANVRRSISRHNGRTWAEGVVGKGATFYFTLPKL